MERTAFALLVLVAFVVFPVASAEPEEVTAVKECLQGALDCQLTEDAIWAVRCIGDSLNGHHCTAP